MRKMLMLILALVLMLTLAACGAEKSVEAPAPEIAPAMQTATEAPTEATTEAPTEAPTTEPEPDPNDFDKFWAGDDLEMPIPEPPFAAEVEYDADRGIYDIRSADNDEIRAMDIQLFKDYCETLKAIGFADSVRENELEVGEGMTGYEFYAERNGSQSVSILHDGRGCMMMVIIQD